LWCVSRCVISVICKGCYDMFHNVWLLWSVKVVMMYFTMCDYCDLKSRLDLFHDVWWLLWSEKPLWCASRCVISVTCKDCCDMHNGVITVCNYRTSRTLHRPFSIDIQEATFLSIRQFIERYCNSFDSSKPPSPFPTEV